MRSLLSCAALLALALANAAHATATAPPSIEPTNPKSVPTNRIPVPMDKPISQITWAATHNSFSYHQYPVRAQNRGMSQQLADGIGGLLLDLHEYKGRAYVCHVTCNDLGYNGKIYPLSEWLNDDILPFMEKNPDAILTIFLESYVEKNLLEAELARAPKIAKMTFNPDTWSNTRSDWPTAGELIENGQRILIFSDKASNKGDYALPGGKAHVMFDRDGTMENDYNQFGKTAFTHNFGCDSHEWKPSFGQGKVNFSNKSWPKLFLMNHFHGLGESLDAKWDNNNTHLWRRVDACQRSSGRTPNFIAVDFYENGDVLDYAATLSHGGIVLWEGNNATQDIVCTIPYTGAKRSINFQLGGQFINGCENDEARSATLLNLKAGSIITLFDSPSGSRENDWVTIEVMKNIKKANINTFHDFVYTPDYRQTYVRNNGLDGKVSLARLGHPEPSMMVFYEGNDATQNIVCTLEIPTVKGQGIFVDFQNDGYGCDNDEARSAMFYNVKKDQRITVYDSPSGSYNEDYAEISFFNDMTYLRLNSFERNYVGSDYKVEYFRKNGLDGKVSAASLSRPTMIGKKHR